jgi:DNA polymerase-3 subunit gamma/tau
MSEKLNIETNSWAVKYRPQKLEDLIGNPTVVTVLKTMFESRNLPNAIFIEGMFGCGKSTVMRMIARYLNCETLDACGECRSCKLELEIHPDYKEINAANNRGIDDIRMLSREARYKPQHNLRIIALDEIHMLTGQSANCFLKPLEETPPQTLFILATSEPQNVLGTILSRCMQLKMLPPSKMEIAKRLNYIAKQEGVKFEKQTLLDIAEASGGHVRDAIAMLETCANLPEGSDYATIINTTSTKVDASLDQKAQKILVGVYLKRPTTISKTLADVLDGEWIGLVTKLMYLNQYIIDQHYTGYNKNIWHSDTNKNWLAYANKHCPNLVNDLPTLIHVANQLVNLRTEMSAFVVPERLLFTARLMQH